MLKPKYKILTKKALAAVDRAWDDIFFSENSGGRMDWFEYALSAGLEALKKEQNLVEADMLASYFSYKEQDKPTVPALIIKEQEQTDD